MEHTDLSPVEGGLLSATTRFVFSKTGRAGHCGICSVVGGHSRNRGGHDSLDRVECQQRILLGRQCDSVTALRFISDFARSDQAGDFERMEAARFRFGGQNRSNSIIRKMEHRLFAAPARTLTGNLTGSVEGSECNRDFQH
jgi:hypothetical protein